MYRDSDTYDEIKKVIIQIYLDYDIREFPIDEEVVCKKLGVSLVPYSEYDRDTRVLLRKRSKCGFFVKGTKGRTPTIYYNDRYESEGARRLTIFHEVKHYVYNEDTDDDEFDDLADFFGRYFMCPIPYLLIKGIETEEEIVSACHVSMEAAGNAASNIRNRKRKHGNRIFDYEIPLLEHLDKDAYEIFIRDQGNEI